MQYLKPVGQPIGGSQIYEVVRNNKIVYIAYISGTEISFNDLTAMQKFLKIR